MWLVGMMGSGKTTVGLLAAGRVGVPFYDTDRMVVETAGKSISQIWEEGEFRFRDLERDAVAAVPAENCIAAAGGGAILDASNCSIIARSPRVVWLRARPEQLARRVRGMTGRPLLDAPGSVAARLAAILDQRSEVYSVVATHVIDTDDKDVADVTSEVVSLWQS